MTKTIHLDKIGVSKLALWRWLKAKESVHGGKKAWAKQRALIALRTKSYTRDEIDSLLDLGRGDYVPFKGADKKAVVRLAGHVTKQRNNVVAAATKKLSKIKL